MRIADLSPTVTPFKDGKTHRASSWSAVDTLGAAFYRDVYHYSTRMVRFYARSADGPWWVNADLLSTGIGSVSDQQGMNQLLREWDFYFTRKGGARIEHPTLGEVA